MHHRHAGSEQHLRPEGLGPCAMTVQCRTTLFGANRARNRNTTPSPQAFFHMLAAVVSDALATDSWSLPSMTAVMRAAAALGVPEHVPPPARASAANAGSASSAGAPGPAEAAAEAVSASRGLDASEAAAACKAEAAPSGGRAAAKGKAKAAASGKAGPVPKAKASSVAAGPPAKRARRP